MGILLASRNKESSSPAAAALLPVFDITYLLQLRYCGSDIVVRGRRSTGPPGYLSINLSRLHKEGLHHPKQTPDVCILSIIVMISRDRDKPGWWMPRLALKTDGSWFAWAWALAQFRSTMGCEFATESLVPRIFFSTHGEILEEA
jgi:hypothetical protein